MSKNVICHDMEQTKSINFPPFLKWLIFVIIFVWLDNYLYWEIPSPDRQYLLKQFFDNFVFFAPAPIFFGYFTDLYYNKKIAFKKFNVNKIVFNDN